MPDTDDVQTPAIDPTVDPIEPTEENTKPDVEVEPEPEPAPEAEAEHEGKPEAAAPTAASDTPASPGNPDAPAPADALVAGTDPFAADSVGDVAAPDAPKDVATDAKGEPSFALPADAEPEAEGDDKAEDAPLDVSKLPEAEAVHDDATPAATADVTTPNAALATQTISDETVDDHKAEDDVSKDAVLPANGTPEAFSPTTVTAADSEPAPEGEDKAEGAEAPAAEAPLQSPLDEARADPDADKEETESTDAPNAAAQGPLDAMRSQTAKDAAPVLQEQQSYEDAALERPLAAQAVEETKGAHDAVPLVAQQQMAKDRHTYANTFAMAGTLEDPTGISGDTGSAQVQGAIAKGAQPSDAISAAAADGAGEGSEDADGDAGDDEDAGSDADSLEAIDGDELSDASDEDVDSGDEGDDEGYFGDLRPEFAPMADIVDDGLDHIKTAAEAGAKAVNVLVAIPHSVLELEHRNVVARMQEIVGELMVLAGRLFKSK